MNMEDIRRMIDEFYYRTGKTPEKLICGKGLFMRLYDEGKIEYNIHHENPMMATFYGIPIVYVNNPDIPEDDKIIILGDNHGAETYRVERFYNTHDIWRNRTTLDDYYKYYKPTFTFHPQYESVPKRDDQEEVSISEEEFLRILNGGG